MFIHAIDSSLSIQESMKMCLQIIMSLVYARALCMHVRMNGYSELTHCDE